MVVQGVKAELIGPGVQDLPPRRPRAVISKAVSHLSQVVAQTRMAGALAVPRQERSAQSAADAARTRICRRGRRRTLHWETTQSSHRCSGHLVTVNETGRSPVASRQWVGPANG